MPPIIAPVLYLITNSLSWSSALDLSAINKIKMALVPKMIQKCKNPAMSQATKANITPIAMSRKYHIP